MRSFIIIIFVIGILGTAGYFLYKYLPADFLNFSGEKPVIIHSYRDGDGRLSGYLDGQKKPLIEEQPSLSASYETPTYYEYGYEYQAYLEDEDYLMDNAYYADYQPIYDYSYVADSGQSPFYTLYYYYRTDQQAQYGQYSVGQ